MRRSTVPSLPLQLEFLASSKILFHKIGLYLWARSEAYRKRAGYNFSHKFETRLKGLVRPTLTYLSLKASLSRLKMYFNDY
jgi:hypothetical protein